MKYDKHIVISSCIISIWTTNFGVGDETTLPRLVLQRNHPSRCWNTLFSRNV